MSKAQQKALENLTSNEYRSALNELRTLYTPEDNYMFFLKRWIKKLFSW